MTGYLATA